MTIHVLTGDALLNNFPEGKLKGSIAISRECLIEGPVTANSLEEFWNQRGAYLKFTYPESDISYEDDVAFEFEKLNDLQEGDEVNLWFTISLLHEKKIAVYRVYPVIDDPDELWEGFGPMSPRELFKCYEQKILLSPEDLQLGKDLWSAYSASDNETLEKLSAVPAKAFPYLKEICKAQIERPERPVRVLKEIINGKNLSFDEIFIEFSEREGIYGLGDTQVQRIYDQLMG